MDERKNIGIAEPLTEEKVNKSLAFKVVLFNDDWHTFDEVIWQLQKALGCSYEHARSIAFVVHVKGQSVVYSGELSQCLKVSSVLEEIALNTQVIS